ncbi:hypothetical protein Amn_45090 [Aminobacter sp. Y103A]|uniref:nuclear transport factor 2 family protein n=1 Tax=Aminobacter sp. Y103A TaxID=1870862 RepID=UPI00257228E1|nr:nuclear transport factor 2 family protein [Aminobacter sp. SS-2016]BBD39629.1 hypothetical protein Amn_45090 [Aminobacter sp. SS-2016]
MGEHLTVEAADDARYSATLAADLETLNTLLHDDLVYGHSTGSADSKVSYVDAIRTGALTYHRIDRNNRMVLDRGQFALVFCTIAMDVTVRGELRNLTNQTVAVWERTSSVWRLLASHSTPLTAIVR